jgi:hypothetical protein
MTETDAATIRDRVQHYIRTGLLETDRETQHFAVALYRQLATGVPVSRQKLAALSGPGATRLESLISANSPSTVDYDAAGACAWRRTKRAPIPGHCFLETHHANVNAAKQMLLESVVAPDCILVTYDDAMTNIATLTGATAALGFPSRVVQQ